MDKSKFSLKNTCLALCLLVLGLLFSELSLRARTQSGVAIMSQNLYVGADLLQVLSIQDPAAIPAAVSRSYQTIKATNFQERAQKLASLIARQQPDIVCLQEVSLLKQQTPSDFGREDAQGAEQVVFDYLELLTAALAAQSSRYQVAIVNENADIELPMAVVTSPDAGSGLNDIRLIDRDVILVKEGLAFEALSQGHFSRQAKFQRLGQEINLKRGYQFIKLALAGGSLCLGNTHLEVGGSATFMQIQAAQALELLERNPCGPMATVLAGDFNAVPTAQPPGTYHFLVAGQGYSDSWLEGFASEPVASGFTCCQQEDLSNPQSQLSERIDLILTRGPLETHTARLVGAEPRDKTPSGLWVSDHAGLLAILTFRNVGEAHLF